MRIGIVECDIPMPELVAQFGDYTQYMKTWLTASVGAEKINQIEFVSYRAYKDEPLPLKPDKLKAHDGLIFSGSKFTAYRNDPWILHTLDFIRLAYQNNVRMFGICFGHQLLARALGGDVGHSQAGWEIAVTSTSTFTCPLLPDARELRLQQMHMDVVTRAPLRAQILGGNEQCDIHAMYEPRRYFSVQGHPEFNQATVEHILRTRMEQKIVPKEYGEDAMKRAGLPHDGLLVGKAVIAFFEDKELPESAED